MKDVGDGRWGDGIPTHFAWVSLVAQRLKRLPGMRETRLWSLGQEDPLEKEMATHSSTLAWKIPWREEPGRLQSMGSQRVGHDWATSLHLPCHNLLVMGSYMYKEDFLALTNRVILVTSPLKHCLSGTTGWKEDKAVLE